MDEEELQMVYSWVDEVPLSRPKRNIARDFSDGGIVNWDAVPFMKIDTTVTVLVAEVVKHHIPRLVELHNYSGANSMDRKMYNWSTLNRECTFVSFRYFSLRFVERVFKKIGLHVPRSEMEDLANAKAGAIEGLLRRLMEKVHWKCLKSKRKRL